MAEVTQLVQVCFLINLSICVVILGNIVGLSSNFYQCPFDIHLEIMCVLYCFFLWISPDEILSGITYQKINLMAKGIRHFSFGRERV